MKSKTYLTFLMAFSTLIGSVQAKQNSSDDKKIVARLDKNFIVTLSDLKQYIAEWNYERRFQHNKPFIYRKAIKELTRDRLRVIDFFDRGLNENQNLMKEVRPILNNELINAFFDKTFTEKYANEKTASEAYNEMGKKIICTELTLPMPEHPTKEMLDSLKLIALEIETGLQKNANIENILKSHSIKEIKIVDTREISWSETLFNPVGKVMFGLKKKFTRVIVAIDGIHIIKVLDIKKIKLQPFEKMKDGIIAQLKKGYYDASNKAYDDFRQGIVDKRTAKWNQSGLDQLVKWSSENEKLYEGAYKDTINNALLNGNNFELLSYKDVKVDLKEYLRLLEGVVMFNPSTYLTSKNVKEFILDAVYDNNVVMAAIKNGMDKQLISPYTQNSIIADRLLYLFNQSVIEASIPKITPESLMRFYEEHKDPIFYQLQKVFVYARVYSDSAKAAADINEIRKGTSFEKVSDSWLIKIFIRERNGRLTAYRTGGGDYLAKAAFQLNLDESAGPIEYDDTANGKQFAVIKCFRIDPEKQLTYDEVKGEKIEEEFKNYYRQQITDEVDAKLKKKYGLEIYEDVLSRAITSESR